MAFHCLILLPVKHVCAPIGLFYFLYLFSSPVCTCLSLLGSLTEQGICLCPAQQVKSPEAPSRCYVMVFISNSPCCTQKWSWVAHCLLVRSKFIKCLTCPNNFTLDTALPCVLSSTPAKCEVQSEPRSPGSLWCDVVYIKQPSMHSDVEVSSSLFACSFNIY